MKAIATDLAGEVCSVGIDTRATDRLVAIYHRSLARRASNLLGEAERPQLEDLVRGTRRLDPATVHFLYRGRENIDAAETARCLRQAGALEPTEVYSGSTDQPWLRHGLREALRSLGWDEENVGRVLDSVPSQTQRALELARQALRSAWPEAWQEHNTLVRYLVYVEGPVRSATVQSTFGAIYAEVVEASDPLRMFELLLHESGHHALALREQFARFLHNPDALGTHALRNDPRPLRGVLHAAYVTCRMASGLRRYLQVHPAGGPLDGCPVQERLEFAHEAIRQALAVLVAAEWTDDGLLLKAALEACAEQEGALA